MAVTRLVVGFAGRPVVGATGWKPALVTDTGTGEFWVQDDTAHTNRWTAAEISTFGAQGLLTLLPERHRVLEGHGVLYAHSEFLAPGVERTIRLSIPDSEFVGSVESYITYTSLEQTTAQWRSWAEMLLRSGETRLRLSRSNPAEAMLARSEALRTRFCTISPTLSDLRRRAFILLLAAQAALGDALDVIEQEASLEFDRAKWSAISLEAFALLGRRAPYRPRPTHRDRLAATHVAPRQLEAR